jgi:GR25 family glycosyltransferase involved in LPS biosynthesis
MKANKWHVINAYFDKIYILTIPRNENRRLFLNGHLEGLHFEYFYGVDGKGLLPLHPEGTPDYDYQGMVAHNREMCEKYLKIPARLAVHQNEIACSLSHRLIYKDIVENGYERALILEDDVACIDANLPFLSEALNSLPTDWEMLYLGYELNFAFDGPMGFKQQLITLLYHAGFRTEAVNNKYVSYPKRVTAHLKVAGVHTNTEAYAIRRNTAQKFIEWQSPVQWIADHLLMDVCARQKIKAFIVHPKIFMQNKKEFESSIWTKA